MRDDLFEKLLGYEKERRVSFAKFVMEDWPESALPAAADYERMYNRWKKEEAHKQWMKDNEANNKASSTG